MRAISRLTGYDQKNISGTWCILKAYRCIGPAKQPGKLDPFQPYLQERMQAWRGTLACCCTSCGSGASRADTRCLPTGYDRSDNIGTGECGASI